MIKSIKEIRDELKYISSPELIDSILKEWADNIVDGAREVLIEADEGDSVYNYRLFKKFKESIK